MIVVDSNVLAARNITGPRTHLARQVEEIDPVWLVPPLWRYEFQNILAKSAWARQITHGEAMAIWAKTAAQLVENEYEASPGRVIDLSLRYRITAYDANFIALAMDMEVTCVTEDRDLLDKFPTVAVSMERFLALGTSPGEVHEARATYRLAKPAASQRGTRKRATAAAPEV